MLSVERQVSLVLRRDLSRFVVPLRALIVRKLTGGYDFGYFGVVNLFLELRVPMIINRDNGYFDICLSR